MRISTSGDCSSGRPPASASARSYSTQASGLASGRSAPASATRQAGAASRPSAQALIWPSESSRESLSQTITRKAG